MGTKSIARVNIVMHQKQKENFLKFSFCFWCITMLTRAMDLVTTRILLNFEAAPPVTLATFKLPSSVLRSSSCLTRATLSLPLNSEHLIRGIFILLYQNGKKSPI